MRGKTTSLIAGMLLVCGTGAHANSAISPEFGGGSSGGAPGILECVPYARGTSGIRIYGDAHTWWSQAAGKYARGSVPKPGSVLAIRPHGNSTLGHVATVSRVVDARTILVNHANWSSPGQIERNVTVMDVSPMNDWSQVRVWFAPIQNLGAAHWPVAGFIYNAKPGKVAIDTARNVKVGKPARTPSTLTKFVAPKTTQVRFGTEPDLSTALSQRKAAAFKPVKTIKRAPQSRRDPIGAIIARAY